MVQLREDLNAEVSAGHTTDHEDVHKVVNIVGNLGDVKTDGIGSLVAFRPDAPTKLSGFLVKRPDQTYANNTPYGAGQLVQLHSEIDVPAGLTPKGNWDSSTAYKLFDWVTLSGVVYYALADNSGQQPDTNRSVWALLPNGYQTVVDRGGWGSGVAYSTWDRVTYGGTSWLAMQASTGQVPGYLSPYWQPTAYPGSLISRMDGAGGAGFSTGIHIGAQLRRTNWTQAPGYFSLWINPYADVGGILINDAPTYAVPGGMTTPYLLVQSVRYATTHKLAQIGPDGSFAVFGSDGLTATCLLTAGDTPFGNLRCWLRAATPGVVPLTLVGASSQTADMFAIYNSVGIKRTTVAPNGSLLVFANDATTPLGALTPDDSPVQGSRMFLLAGTPATSVLAMRAAASQTADIMPVYSSASVKLASINAAGDVSVFGSSGASAVGVLARGDAGAAGYRLRLLAGAAGTTVLALVGAPSQTADLLSAINSASVKRSSIALDGSFCAFRDDGTTLAAVLSPGEGGYFGSRMALLAGAATTVPLSLLGATGQTAALLVAKTNNVTVLALAPSGQWVSAAANEATGIGVALLGANCPAVTAAAPYRWEKITTSDGSQCYYPVWK